MGWIDDALDDTYHLTSRRLETTRISYTHVSFHALYLPNERVGGFSPSSQRIFAGKAERGVTQAN
jgi:hypothetical protein